MIYLESFTLPDEDIEERILGIRAEHNGGTFGYIDNPYPCGIFTRKGLSFLRFGHITLLYGGNGSGKSTLLNLIAERLRLARIAPFNSSEMFMPFAANCSFELATGDDGAPCTIPEGSRIITSDDVFDFMLTVRSNNEEIADDKERAREEHTALKFGKTIKFNSMADYEEHRMQVLARRRSLTRRQFIRRNSGEELTLNSNGETAMFYFNKRLEDDRLYCLDEPENSLSPRLQQKLAELLQQTARYCGCQYIIATHSPFLLAMDGAVIYDLDSDPVETKNWWELENPRQYFEFFDQHRALFTRANHDKK